MFIPETKIETTTTKVWTVPTPCVWKDLQDAIAYIKGGIGEFARWDDAVTVSVGDEGIKFSRVVEVSR